MTVLARTRQRDLELDGQGTLMTQCLLARLPVGSSCAGRGACGKCVVTVLEGQRALWPPDPRECLVLARNELAPGTRLSCQARVRFPAEKVVISTGYW